MRALAAAGAASAADLPSRKGPVVAPVYAPVFTWTGFYVGLNAGAAFSNSRYGFAPFGADQKAVAEVRAWLADHPRFHAHFTPTSGSCGYPRLPDIG